MNHKKGLLIILSGPSGVGKGTIREELFKDGQLKLVYSISMTTRKPRNHERHKKDYFFVSEEEFIFAINNNQLLEYAQFVDHYYGTPKEFVDAVIENGNNLVLEIEVQGAMQVIKNRPDSVSIFITPPNFNELERRIRTRRTEDEKIIAKRLTKAQSEIHLDDQYDYVVINDNVEQTVNEIRTIILNEMQKNQ